MSRARPLIPLAVIAAVACATRPVADTPKPESPSLIGVNWRLVEIQYSDGTTLRPEDPGAYSVAFLPAGVLSIRADCNKGNGKYTVSGPILKIGPIATTRAMCPPGSISDRYLQGLGIAASYRFRDGDLYVAMAMDSGILRFTPAE